MIRHDDVIKDGWDCQECGHGQEPWDCDLALAVLRKAARGFDFMKGGGSVFIDTGWIDLTPAEEALLHELVES